MACRNCRQQARLLARSINRSTDLCAPSSQSPSLVSPVTASTQASITPTRRRQFSHTAWRPAGNANSTPNIKVTSTPKAPSGKGEGGVVRKVANSMPAPNRIASAYMLNKQLERLYKVCSAPAAYTIDEELRNRDEVPKTAEGEELGTPQGPWLEIFNLSPSFSSWSHVTMLHMYLIFSRMRGMDRDTARATQAQFVDNFFFDCERVMHLNHGMTSSALRQRYLKDIFMQWRGLIAAYDEGVAKGSDKVLAAALWRNLFKAREDVDFRNLAAVVAWVRATLKDLEAVEVEDLLVEVMSGGSRPGSSSPAVFKRDPRSFFKLVDQPSAALKGLYPSGSKGADEEVEKVEQTVEHAPGP